MAGLFERVCGVALIGLGAFAAYNGMDPESQPFLFDKQQSIIYGYGLAALGFYATFIREYKE